MALNSSAMTRTEWWISMYVAVLCLLTYRLTLEVKYLKEDGVTIRNAPWSVLQPAVSLWQRPRRDAAPHIKCNRTPEFEAADSAQLSPAAAPAVPHVHDDNGTCSCKVQPLTRKQYTKSVRRS